MMYSARTLATLFSLIVLLPVAAFAADEPDLTQLYTKTEQMIPMRDEVKLYCEIYTPVDQQGDLPILLMRTPYGTKGADGGFTRYFATNFRQLALDRYIIVVQDSRGRHLSEGKFEWNRPLRHRDDPNAIDASTDAYDTIDWLVKNVPRNNGRVGMLGVSYPGWYVTMALVDPHPALKAASPQASPSDYFVGDDFFHNGAFRLSPSAELPYLFDFDPKTNARFPYDQVDTYEFFLDLGPISNMNARYLKNVSPTWDNFMNHATYDEYWQRGGTLQHLTSHDVPTLEVVGWWDAENLNGQLDIYTKVEPLDDDNQNFLVVGPWSHGQWSRGPADALGAYKFGSDTMSHYQREIESKFFAHHLKGAADPQLAEATLFQTGSNKWKTYDSWPPKRGVITRSLYFESEGKLSFEEPRAGEKDPFESYISDPANPVPYSKRPIMGFWQGMEGSKDPRFGRAGINWKVEDQRFVDGRPDVLTFVTEPLEEPVELTGTVVARLFGSTSGTDCDWVVKLIDVYPEKYEAEPEMGGYQLMIADDVVRAKFRHSLANPQPVEPGKVEEYTIDLRTRNHLFRPGHRIMVQVQSTWFPLIDRNPQTFVDIPSAKASDFKKTEQRVYFSPEYPSRIELMVAEGDDVAR